MEEGGLKVCHGIVLRAVELYDEIVHLLRGWSLSTQLVEGKRPAHILLASDSALSMTHLTLLEGECRQLGISNVTIMCDEGLSYHSEAVRILPRRQPEVFATSLALQKGPISKLPGMPIDLVISTERRLNLTGLDGTLLGFAEFFHHPHTEFITLPIWRSALCQYAQCKQNYGK